MKVGDLLQSKDTGLICIIKRIEKPKERGGVTLFFLDCQSIVCGYWSREVITDFYHLT